MEANQSIMYLILLAGLIYETSMFVYRKAKNGEVFDLKKYALTYGYVALLAVSAYMVTGLLPEVSTVIAQLGESIPDFNVVFTLLTSVILGVFQKYIKGGAAANYTPTAQQPTTQTNLPSGGCNVNPSIGGKVFHLIYGLTSPVTVSFALDATQPTTDHSGYTSVDINWDDGSTQNVPLVKGHADAEHTYTFKKTDKYTGKTFNPVFTFNESTGEKFVINGDGRSVEIGVESP
jgi:hypothetical protein